MTTRSNHWMYDLIPHETRKATNKLIEMVDAGLLDKRDVIVMALNWMSEDDVKAMCEANEINLDTEDGEDEED